MPPPVVDGRRRSPAHEVQGQLAAAFEVPPDEEVLDDDDELVLELELDEDEDEESEDELLDDELVPAPARLSVR
jgi:hypothetical protein